MGSIVTKGRTEPCIDSIAGIKNVYVANYNESAFTLTAGLVTGFALSLTEVFKYPARPDGSTFSEVMTPQQNGTRVNVQTLVVELPKLDSETKLQLELLSAGRPHFIVEDYNGKYRVVGIDNGCIVVPDSTHGAAKADYYGWKITATAEEKLFAPFLDAAAITSLQGLVAATNVDPDL